MLPEITESTKEQNIASLLEKIQHFTNQYKSKEIQAFIKSDESYGITSKDIAQIIKTTINPTNAILDFAVGAEIFKAFIESERSVGITRKNVAEIIKDASQKTEIFKAFIENERSVGITSKDVSQMISDGEITDDKSKSLIIKAFIRSERSVRITSKDVSQMIEDAEMANDEAKSITIKAFIRSERSLGINNEIVKQMISDVKITDDDYKFSIIKAFIRSKRSLGINNEIVKQMISDVKITDDDYKSSIIKVFAIDTLCRGIKEDSDQINKIETFFNERGESLRINDRDAQYMDDYYSFGDGITAVKIFINYSIDNLIKEMEGKSDETKSTKINNFIHSFHDRLESDGVVKIIKDSNIADDNVKFSIIKTYIDVHDEDGYEIIDSEDIINMINGAKFSDNKKEVSLIRTLFESFKSREITSDDVIQIINNTGIKDDNDKSLIIQAFIYGNHSRMTITSENVTEMINGAEINGNNAKSLIIQALINRKIGEGDDENAFSIIKNFIDSKILSNPTPKDFVDMINGVKLQFRPDLTITLYQSAFESSPDYIGDFIKITKDLHASEAVKCQFVNGFTNTLHSESYEEYRDKLKPFISEIQENELAKDLLEKLYSKKILVNRLGALNFAKDRTRVQYPFLTETFGDKALQECITQNGINNLKGNFGNDLKLDDGNPITITALISYYDIVNMIPSLSTMLNPEFKTELQNKFSPSADKLLYKPQELEKLNQLLKQDGVEFDANSYFIKNEVLCNHLREKAGVIEEVNLGTTYQINFTNYSRKKPNSGDEEMIQEVKSREEAVEKERQQGINDLFNKILKSQNPGYEDVDNFVSRFFGVFPPKEDNKLVKFFTDNKKELAYCLCKETEKKGMEKEGMEEGFKSLFTTQDDGCYANISMQFQKMLYSTMFRDREDRILYSVADTKIFSAIGAGQDITHEGPPLDNRVIKSYSLSPMALIEKITQEEMLNSITTTKIIDKNIGEEGKLKLLERLDEKDSYELLLIEDGGKLMDKEMKEIAGYFITKKVVGEEKMKELESKNPKLKEIGDFIYKSPQTSPKATSSSPAEDSILGKRKQSDGGPGLN